MKSGLARVDACCIGSLGDAHAGLAAARQFIKEGATVVVTGRSSQSISNAQKELGTNGIGIAADVTKLADLQSLFKQVRERCGRIDILYVNAGIAKLGSVADTTEEVSTKLSMPTSAPPTSPSRTHYRS